MRINQDKAEELLRHFNTPKSVFEVSKSTGLMVSKLWYKVSTLLINGKLKKVGENKYVRQKDQ